MIARRSNPCPLIPGGLPARGRRPCFSHAHPRPSSGRVPGHIDSAPVREWNPGVIISAGTHPPGVHILSGVLR